MTTTDWDGSEDWMKAYPTAVHDLLRRYGVADPMTANAARYNARLIALSKQVTPDEPRFALELEAIFKEEFGDIIARHANSARQSAGASELTHVELRPDEQVSIANAIGHIIRRYHDRAVRGIAGITVNEAAEPRLFVGGVLPEQALVAAAGAFVQPGAPLLTRQNTDDFDGAVTITGGAGRIHTRDRNGQQAAVVSAIDALRRWHQAGRVEFVLGVTVDELGRIVPFAGGETEADLVDAALEEIRGMLRRAIRRGDH